MNQTAKMFSLHICENKDADSCAVTEQLISVFVFVTLTVR